MSQHTSNHAFSAPLSEPEIASLVDSMCMTMRHDFGLEADPDHPLGAGMTNTAREGLRADMRQLVHHHVLPLLAKARVLPHMQEALPAAVNLDTLAMRIFAVQSASCTCMTKSPAFAEHASECRYRVLAECAALVGAMTNSSFPHQR